MKQAPMPHSVDGEQGILGSMLISPKLTIPECVSKVSPSWFYVPAHHTVYVQMVEMWTQGQAIDLITLTQRLWDMKLLDAVGGAGFVTSLFTFVPSAANVNYYIEIVRDKHILREIIAASTESARRAYAEEIEVAALLEEARERLGSIDSRERTERKTLAELVQEKMERMERGEHNADFIKTGITRLDAVSPLRKKDMAVISGERKSGKTMLALTIAKNVAAVGTHVAFMSLESPSGEAIDRLLAGISRIPIQQQDHISRLTQEEIKRSLDAAATLKNLPLHLYDDVLDLSHIVAEGRRLKSQGKLGLLIVDYLQLIRTAAQKDRNREQEVAHISRTLRLLALELNIPVIALSQLNEEGRARESRAIEQDTTAMWQFTETDPPDVHLRRIYIPFQRNGESGGAVTVTFLASIGRIENYAPENQTPQPR